MGIRNSATHLVLVFSLLLLGGSVLLCKGLWLPGRNRKSSFILFDPEHPCGVAIACLVSHLFDTPIDLPGAERLVRVDYLGRTSMAELIEALEDIGLSAVGVSLHAKALYRLRQPVVLHVRQSHFLVVLPTGTSSVIVLDPPSATPELTTVRSLCTRWDGKAILVAQSRAELDALLRELRISTSR